MPGGHPGLDPSIRSLVGRFPFGMRRGEQARARCRRGDSFRMERIPHAPKKNSGRDGVVTSSLSLAAAQGAPAHSFCCSSFSHRKTLWWEPCNFPPRPTLKRPKEGLRPFLWKPCLETDGGDGGRGVCGYSGRFGLRETRLGGGLVDLEPALGVRRLWPL